MHLNTAHFDCATVCVFAGSAEDTQPTQLHVFLLWPCPQHQQPGVWQQAVLSAGQRAGQAAAAAALEWKPPQTQTGPRDPAVLGCWRLVQKAFL